MVGYDVALLRPLPPGDLAGGRTGEPRRAGKTSRRYIGPASDLRRAAAGGVVRNHQGLCRRYHDFQRLGGPCGRRVELLLFTRLFRRLSSRLYLSALADRQTAGRAGNRLRHPCFSGTAEAAGNTGGLRHGRAFLLSRPPSLERHSVTHAGGPVRIQSGRYIGFCGLGTGGQCPDPPDPVGGDAAGEAGRQDQGPPLPRHC